MAKRKSISKKTRFEVFKRDEFTCLYCGKKAPEVILEVDHIKPKSKGGSDKILNFATSCRECNRGKRDIPLDDQSTLQKQRRQIEELQEKREQTKMMFEWRESLKNLEDDILNQVIQHINSKIGNFSLNNNGERTLKKLINKFNLSDILESIDLSAKKYLKYDSSDNLTEESVENFINKIGGILNLQNKPPIERKMAYIRGICRHRFSYWDNSRGAIILCEYVNALKEHGYTNREILEDLEDEVEPKTKQAKNWSEWRCLIEGWTDDIKKWKKE